MKKTIQLVTVLLVAGIGMIYIFIPGNLVMQNGIAVNCTSAAGMRYFLDREQWKKWWPGEDEAVNRIGNDVGFFYRKVHHRPETALFNGFRMNSIMDGDTYAGEFVFAQIGSDSMALFWKNERSVDLNPIHRITEYFRMKKLKENTAGILLAAKSFLEDREKVYGMKVQHLMVTDTLLISTKLIFSNDPDNHQIYSMVESLEKYIQQNHAKQTGYPMMNVTVLDSNHYQTMVALPVDRTLPQNPMFAWKKMVAGKILMSEVRGGPNTVQHAVLEMQRYVTDYHLTSPAIPFVSLVTDRRSETDSAKWISRIYFPVM